MSDHERILCIVSKIDRELKDADLLERDSQWSYRHLPGMISSHGDAAADAGRAAAADEEAYLAIDSLIDVLKAHRVISFPALAGMAGARFVELESCDPGDICADPEFLFYVMTSSERESLARLPDQVTIYRGQVSAGDDDVILSREQRIVLYGALWQQYCPTRIGGVQDEITGNSWTLDRDIALFFAKRTLPVKGAGWIFSATVQRSSIIAMFLRKNESEVLIQPWCIENYEREFISA